MAGCIGGALMDENAWVETITMDRDCTTWALEETITMNRLHHTGSGGKYIQPNHNQ